MAMPLLTTKLYIPPIRPELVSRPRLIEQLNAGLHCKLTLVSAPAGFGKTTLFSEWATQCRRPVAWVTLDEGEPMARLLRRALSRGIAPNYVARLLAAFGQEVEVTPSAMESLIEPLSERELEVLRLIVAGLSNPGIAQELVIAVSTVKSHVNHIYGKLGVKSRAQAVVKAQELALL